jgi:predicted PurR-regulated permease PerM
MDFQEILFSILGVILTGLASWGTTVLIQWLNSKIKNKKLAAFAATILTVVTSAVKATYQSYVEGLKGTDAWTKEAQEKALQMALDTAKEELTTEALAYIEKQHGDVDKYIKTLIESILYDLKNSNKILNTSNENK